MSLCVMCVHSSLFDDRFFYVLIQVRTILKESHLGETSKFITYGCSQSAAAFKSYV